MLRGRTVPVIDLSESLGAVRGPSGESATVVVAYVGAQRVAIEVDRSGRRG